MKVPFVHGPHNVCLDDVDRPQAGDRDAVIKVAFVGVCGSDLGVISAGGIGGRPVPLGHELSGTVIACGKEVKNLAPGDRIVLNPLINYIGIGGPEGGFAEQLLVRDIATKPQSLLRLPDKLSLEQGALVEPLSVSAHAINRVTAARGDKVAIFGAGPIGLGTIVMLRHRGISDIVVFDPSPLRRDRALKLGARLVADPLRQPAAETLAEAHGAGESWSMRTVGTSLFFDACGAPDVLADIIQCAPYGSRVSLVAVPKKPATLNLAIFVAKELSISAAMGYPNEFTEVIEMLTAGNIDVSAMVSHRFDPGDVLQAFEIAARPNDAAKVLVQYSN